jgi:hypothetical protein
MSLTGDLSQMWMARKSYLDEAELRMPEGRLVVQFSILVLCLNVEWTIGP